jgi:hypothetical protein
MQSQGGDLNSHLKVFAVVAAMALLIPAGATAKRSDDKPAKGNKHGKVEKTPKLKLASANVKGVVVTNAGTTMTVTVDKVSGHLKGCKGQTLTFDVTDARVHTADNDADADMDAADVLVGHAVKVRTKVARMKGRKTTCGVLVDEVLPAKAVHNRTTPQVEDEAEETEDVDETEDVEEADEVEETEDVEEADEVEETEDVETEETDVDETETDEGDEL